VEYAALRAGLRKEDLETVVRARHRRDHPLGETGSADEKKRD
jgi:hypothetical protein